MKTYKGRRANQDLTFLAFSSKRVLLSWTPAAAPASTKKPSFIFLQKHIVLSSQKKDFCNNYRYSISTSIDWACCPFSCINIIRIKLSTRFKYSYTGHTLSYFLLELMCPASSFDRTIFKEGANGYSLVFFCMQIM